jgi:hypothetical protein
MLTFVTGKKEEEESCFPSLTLKERITGWIICYLVGICL